MVNRIERARDFRKAIDRTGMMLTDAQASTVSEIYPTMKYNKALIKAGTRIYWKGVLKRAAADLWDREGLNPDNSPNLWEDVPYRDGYRIIPETITAGLAFAKDELGWWGDELMRSRIDNNVWTPEQYADGWEVYNNG